jgi:hypothetical protein
MDLGRTARRLGAIIIIIVGISSFVAVFSPQFGRAYSVLLTRSSNIQPLIPSHKRLPHRPWFGVAPAGSTSARDAVPRSTARSCQVVEFDSAGQPNKVGEAPRSGDAKEWKS